MAEHVLMFKIMHTCAILCVISTTSMCNSYLFTKHKTMEKCKNYVIRFLILNCASCGLNPKACLQFLHTSTAVYYPSTCLLPLYSLPHIALCLWPLLPISVPLAGLFVGPYRQHRTPLAETRALCHQTRRASAGPPHSPQAVMLLWWNIKCWYTLPSLFSPLDPPTGIPTESPPLPPPPPAIRPRRLVLSQPPTHSCQGRT